MSAQRLMKCVCWRKPTHLNRPDSIVVNSNVTLKYDPLVKNQFIALYATSRA